MKVNLNQQFKGFDGTIAKTEDTMRIMLSKGLFAGKGVKETDEEKYAAYKLNLRLMANEEGEIELDKDERKLLRSVACASLVPGAFGQIADLLKEKEE